MTTRNPAVSEAELHAYVDGRLAEERRGDMEEFLAAHPEELARVRVYQEQNRLLRACFSFVLAEPIPTAWRTSLRRPRWRLEHFAAALICLVVGALLGWYAGARSTPMAAKEIAFARQAAVAHAVYTPEVRHPVEVTADQERHLVNWLSKRLGDPIKVPPLLDLGYELVGGRLLPGEPGPVAQFMYQEASGRRLTLYIRTDPGSERETAFRYLQHGRVAVFYWLDRRLSYALSGEMPKDELLKIANVIYQRLNP